MNAKRKKTQEFIIKYIDKVAKGGENKKLYEDLFSKMSDKEFDEFMHKLKRKEITLSIIVPNKGNVKVDINNNYKLADELGFKFFQKLKYTGMKDVPDHKTNIDYLVMRLPIKRASQLLSKKISIPEDTKSIDVLSGQVTGKSRASKLTMPEIQMLTGMGLDRSIIELLKYRGGDVDAANAFNNILYKQGMVTQSLLEEYSSGVTSSKTLKSYLIASHIKTEGL